MFAVIKISQGFYIGNSYTSHCTVTEALFTSGMREEYVLTILY